MSDLAACHARLIVFAQQHSLVGGFVDVGENEDDSDRVKRMKNDNMYTLYQQQLLETPIHRVVRALRRRAVFAKSLDPV
jgi:hypothetical protein